MIADKISIDIDLNGKEEVGIGVTCGNAGCDYHLFSSTSDGGHKYLGNLFFHPRAITTNPETNLIKTYIRLNAAEGCDIYYTKNNQGFTRLK